jgi:hypothetical protein
VTERIQLILSPGVRGHIRELFTEIPHRRERRPDFSGLDADVFGGAVECSGGAHNRQVSRHKVFQALVICFRPCSFNQTHDGLPYFGGLSPPAVQPVFSDISGSSTKHFWTCSWTFECPQIRTCGDQVQCVPASCGHNISGNVAVRLEVAMVRNGGETEACLNPYAKAGVNTLCHDSGRRSGR